MRVLGHAKTSLTARSSAAGLKVPGAGGHHTGGTRFVVAAAMAIATGTLGAACATPPKPRELEAFDALRKANEANLGEVAKRSPDLTAEADRRSATARDEWQSNDLPESRRDALTALIKLKSALAIYEQDQLKAQLQTLSGEQAQAEEESAGLAKDLASEQEKLALLQKYVDARKTADADKQKLSQQMTSEQQKALAEQQRLSQQLASEQKIALAQLAMRTADTVEASRYASADYTAAGDLLAKAQADLKQNDYTSAQVSADIAKKDADRATELAKPQYEQAAQTNENKARNEALARDAPTIPGVKVRIDPRGDLQRLVIVIPEMFTKRSPGIAPGHDQVLDGVASLLKKYPSYPVQIIGYTDNRGKSGELMAISAARAQAVYSALAERGVDAKMLMASGLGGEEPFVDNRSAAGRAKNNRVEIVFLYH
jgi:outer membrane protein OmpA-like peptidoglycan-associated protein